MSRTSVIPVDSRIKQFGRDITWIVLLVVAAVIALIAVPLIVYPMVIFQEIAREPQWHNDWDTAVLRVIKYVMAVIAAVMTVVMLPLGLVYTLIVGIRWMSRPDFEDEYRHSMHY